MSRSPRPDNQARQDQALALLRDRYPFPLSTGEIAREVWQVVHGHWVPRCEFEDRGGGVLVRVRHARGCHTHCPKVWVAYRPGEPQPDAVATRAAMLRLARDNLVERVDLEGMRHTYWRAVFADA